MSVTLSPEIEAAIRQRVDAGLYEDAEAVVRQALSVLEMHERLEALRASLVEANEQIERGEFALWTPELMDRLGREAGELVRRGHRPHPDVCL
jgi:antitoxin ParD1/3/4